MPLGSSDPGKATPRAMTREPGDLPGAVVHRSAGVRRTNGISRETTVKDRATVRRTRVFTSALAGAWIVSTGKDKNDPSVSELHRHRHHPRRRLRHGRRAESARSRRRRQGRRQWRRRAGGHRHPHRPADPEGRPVGHRPDRAGHRSQPGHLGHRTAGSTAGRQLHPQRRSGHDDRSQHPRRRDPAHRRADRWRQAERPVFDARRLQQRQPAGWRHRAHRAAARRPVDPVGQPGHRRRGQHRHRRPDRPVHQLGRG